VFAEDHILGVRPPDEIVRLRALRGARLAELEVTDDLVVVRDHSRDRIVDVLPVPGGRVWAAYHDWRQDPGLMADVRRFLGLPVDQADGARAAE